MRQQKCSLCKELLPEWNFKKKVRVDEGTNTKTISEKRSSICNHCKGETLLYKIVKQKYNEVPDTRRLDNKKEKSNPKFKTKAKFAFSPRD